MIDSLESELISASGGLKEDNFSILGELTFLKNPNFEDSFVTIESKFDNEYLKRTFNLVSDRVQQLDSTYYKDIARQSADDPIMRKHPNWDNLEYRYFIDNFKNLNLIQRLTFLRIIKVRVMESQIEYYTSIKE